MNNVLKMAIQEATGRDISKEAFDYAQDASTSIDKGYVSNYLKDLFNGAANSPQVMNAMIDDLCDSMAQSTLVKCKNIQWIKDGQVDWVAFRTSFISLGEGLYIKTEYATREALEYRAEQQEQNLQKAVVKRDAFMEIKDTLISVMDSEGLYTAGEAIDYLGYGMEE